MTRVSTCKCARAPALNHRTAGALSLKNRSQWLCSKHGGASLKENTIIQMRIKMSRVASQQGAQMCD